MPSQLICISSFSIGSAEDNDIPAQVTVVRITKLRSVVSVLTPAVINGIVVPGAYS